MILLINGRPLGGKRLTLSSLTFSLLHWPVYYFILSNIILFCQMILLVNGKILGGKGLIMIMSSLIKFNLIESVNYMM